MQDNNLSIILIKSGRIPDIAEFLGNLIRFIDSLSAIGDHEILLLDQISESKPELGSGTVYSYLNVQGVGYGDALKKGIEAAQFDLILTMAADGSHNPSYIPWMLSLANNYDYVIGSRFRKRGGIEISWLKYLPNKLINRWLSFICSLSISDLTSNFRLINRGILDEIQLSESGIEIDIELCIKTYGYGFRITEVPICHHPSKKGLDKSFSFSFFFRMLASSLKLRSYRNSIEFCDYDERAFNSRILLQRIWQRQRYHHIKQLHKPQGVSLDIGCGSGRMILAYPQLIGIDINLRVLRYLAKEPRKLVNAIGEKLPFRDNSFDSIFCCEVAEHLPQDSPLFSEIARILRPGGKALFTTPDYGTPIWPTIERLYILCAPNAYGHTHISKYNQQSLPKILNDHGLELQKKSTMFGAIIIMLFQKRN